MKFVLEIQLGNDAMQTGEDVADALHAAADKLVTELADENISDYVTATRHHLHTSIRDLNGNTVGRYEVKGGRVK